MPWLIKSEFDVYSIADMERDERTSWDGVRNYEARNNLRKMKVGEEAIFYQTNAKPPGAVGVVRVVKVAHPDPTQFDKKSPYFDAKSPKEAPRWDQVEVAFVERFPTPVPLSTLKADRSLTGMTLTSGKAMRLSVQPLSAAHLRRIRALVSRSGA